MRFKTNIKHYLAKSFGRYIYIITYCICYRRKFSLDVKLPTIWTDGKDRWKSRGGKNQRGEEQKREDQRREKIREERRSEKRKSQKKEDAGARKGRKVAIHSVFPLICGCGGSKSRLAKAAGAEQSGQMRDEKLHAVVARITFASEKVKNTSPSEHYWKLKCRKSACRFGAEHISKSKVLKSDGLGPLFEVEMLKKCTLLWREAHFQVKM